ncbi:MAG: M20 family metallopeptidase [Sedimentibacter sp.]|uniref:M20 metallopeptidase family protein n=1 Tax=Sedimentibacter sp. TaxID=1960295 RepID=UPI003159474E
MYNIESMKDEIVTIRRDFHRNPELGGFENQTMERICRYLDSWGIEYQKGVADTGVVAIVRGKNKDKNSTCVGVRADIDALPVSEETDIDFKSLNTGVMHACGHDAHTAIALGTAKVIKSMEEDLRGDVKFFFQPAEETTGGAERMIREGCMKNPDVEYVVGLHVDPGVPTGKISLKYGKMMASSDEIIIRVRGKSTHGAHPHQGVDPLVICSSLIMALQSLVSRRISPLNSAVFTLGTIHGGTRGNIIPDEVEMTGILRTLDPDTRSFMKEKIRDLVENVPKGFGGEGILEVRESYMALINSDEAVDKVRHAAGKIIGSDNIEMSEYPNMGTEDFSYFAAAAKSCFFNLGCRNEKIDAVYPIHSSKFKLDEDCLAIGVMLQVENVLSLMGQ